jgi:two-component system, LytTR family, sensor kinase
MSGKKALVLFLIWSVPGLIAAIQVHVLLRPGLLDNIAWQVPPWWAWAPATLAIQALLEERSRLRKVVGLAAVILGAAFAQAAILHVTSKAFSHQQLPKVPPLAAILVLMQKYALLDGLAAVCTLAWARGRTAEKRLKAQELAASKLEAALSRAQLEMLRGQLQPHFLFNTLNAIRVLVRQGRAEEGDHLIAQLSDLLRLSLRHGERNEVPLGEELAFVNHYLRIQRARFPDRLSVEIDVPSELLELSVPPLLLQPIVENALEHGVLRKIEPSCLRLSARRREGELVIEVIDDGLGPPAQINEGVGLRNVRERLAQLYPDGHRLELQQGPSGGALCRVRLPLRS